MRLTRTSPPHLLRAAAKADPEAFAAMIGGGKPSPFASVVARASAEALTPSDNDTTPSDNGATPTGKRRRHDEDDLQRATCRLFDTKFAHRCFAFHVPNGGRRGKIEAARLVGMGVRAGVADWIVLLPGGKFAAIELKRRTGGYLSPEQKSFRDTVEALGVAVLQVVREHGVDATICTAQGGSMYNNTVKAFQRMNANYFFNVRKWPEGFDAYIVTDGSAVRAGHPVMTVGELLDRWPDCPFARAAAATAMAENFPAAEVKEAGE